MFIAHLPAGYLLTRHLAKVYPECKWASMMGVGLVAAVAPDLDLIYHYTLDNRVHPHHSYATHTPFFWLVVAGLSCAILLIARRRQWLPYVVIALANILLHLVLDSVAAEIYWLWPFSNVAVNLVQVPSGRDPWVLNFVLHWTFLLEIGIVGLGLVVFVWDVMRARRAVSDVPDRTG